MRFLAEVEYRDANKNYVTTLYKIVEAPTELDASLKIFLDKSSDEEMNIYERIAADGLAKKTLVDILPLNEDGEAFKKLPATMIGSDLGEC